MVVSCISKFLLFFTIIQSNKLFDSIINVKKIAEKRLFDYTNVMCCIICIYTHNIQVLDYDLAFHLLP